MENFRKQEGFILINTIILSLVALIMLLGLSLLIYYGSKLSGIEKRYTSALEAAKGGTLECLTALKDCFNNWTISNSFNCTISNPFKCRRSTDTWTAFTSTSLSDLTSHASPQDIINFPDWQKDYGSYKVYCKIIDTRGYTNGYFYAVEVVAQKIGGNETAWLSVGYRLEIVGL